MKLPLPSTFDGRVLAELFQEEIEPAQNPLSISREPRTGIARDKLKNLLVD